MREILHRVRASSKVIFLCFLPIFFSYIIFEVLDIDSSSRTAAVLSANSVAETEVEKQCQPSQGFAPFLPHGVLHDVPFFMYSSERDMRSDVLQLKENIPLFVLFTGGFQAYLFLLPRASLP